MKKWGTRMDRWKCNWISNPGLLIEYCESRVRQVSRPFQTRNHSKSLYSHYFKWKICRDSSIIFCAIDSLQIVNILFPHDSLNYFIFMLLNHIKVRSVLSNYIVRPMIQLNNVKRFTFIFFHLRISFTN